MQRQQHRQRAAPDTHQQRLGGDDGGTHVVVQMCDACVLILSTYSPPAFVFDGGMGRNPKPSTEATACCCITV